MKEKSLRKRKILVLMAFAVYNVKTMSRIIISDVHGCYDTLMALIAKLPKDVPITFAGDLIDRGPDSAKVIDFVKNNGHDCVMGNHELMMIQDTRIGTDRAGNKYYTGSYFDGVWLMNGGDKTLDSYSDSDGKMDSEKYKQHLDWLSTLPYYLEYPELKNKYGDHLLVTHSTAAEVWGIYSPENPIFQENVLWARKGFPSKIDGIFNVYGHTPQQYKATVKVHFACIDGGAYFKRQPYGKMIALQYPEMIQFEQENIESDQ